MGSRGSFVVSAPLTQVGQVTGEAERGNGESVTVKIKGLCSCLALSCRSLSAGNEISAQTDTRGVSCPPGQLLIVQRRVGSESAPFPAFELSLGWSSDQV